MNKRTVRERADAIERLQTSFSTVSIPNRRSYTALPGYSRSTVSSLKRSSMSGFTDTSCRLNKLRKLDSSSRESSPTLSDISVSSKEDDRIDSVTLYAKIIQYQHLTREMEQEYKQLEEIAENELEALEKELKGLEAEEKEQESQNKLDALCKQITSCMGQIEVITKGEGAGDLDNEKKILASILSQLNEANMPTLYTNTDLLIECRKLIKAIIEA